MKKLKVGMLSVILLLIDLWSKSWIESNLRIGESITVISGFFEITHYRNTGAAWSMFDSDMMMPIFLMISMIVSAIALYYLFKDDRTLVLLSILFILPGNMGNFYDRISFGYVRDMLSFNIFGYHYPVFNVADICLVIGFGFLFLHTYLEEKKGQHDENNS